jgi:leader peptidase (prepilin peptidase)/N-methyltransferase
MIRILGTIFAGLLGLAFGSFLNVCLSRWPEGESVVKPRSHCRNCDHTLAWWENIPLQSWIVLRGRCRKCGAPIGWRYPVVELAVGALWAATFWRSLTATDPFAPADWVWLVLVETTAAMALAWLLVALAVLDAENLWLPNFLTIPGTILGLVVTIVHEEFASRVDVAPSPLRALLSALVAIAVCAGLILLIRWLYQLIRHREGIGLGDAKLMALLAAWLGLPGALLSFAIGAILGSLAALSMLAVPAARRNSESWAATKLPLGTFLCIGGIISALWGQPLIGAYLRWAGFCIH